MRKIITILVLMLVLWGCTQEEQKTNKHIEELVIVTVPIVDPQVMLEGLEVLKPLLIDAYTLEGYTIDSVRIDVLTSHNAAGEALVTGNAHLALIGSTTYVEYEAEGVEVLLGATKAKVSKDSPNARDWNNQVPTIRDSDEPTTYIQALILTGPSVLGQQLADEVNTSRSIPWSMLSQAQWCISGSTTSSIAYVYPNLWLYENYGKLFSDLEKSPLPGTFSDTMLALADQTCDVGLGYSFILSDYQNKWMSEFKREKDIFTEVNVIGVTRAIMNDVLAISTQVEWLEDAFKATTQKIFMELVKNERAAPAFKIYNILGYQPVRASDYEDTRKAYQFMKEKIK